MKNMQSAHEQLVPLPLVPYFPQHKSFADMDESSLDDNEYKPAERSGPSTQQPAHTRWFTVMEKGKSKAMDDVEEEIDNGLMMLAQGYDDTTSCIIFKNNIAANNTKIPKAWEYQCWPVKGLSQFYLV